MSPAQHVTVSVTVGAILGLFLRSWAAAFSCCIAGIFIDLDHLIDFWVNRGFSVNIRQFFDFCYRGTSSTFCIVLHGYEYIPFFLWFGSVPACRNIGWGLTLGYTLHLLGDQFFNTHLSRWTYFFSYRLYHRFAWNKIVRHNPFI